MANVNVHEITDGVNTYRFEDKTKIYEYTLPAHEENGFVVVRFKATSEFYSIVCRIIGEYDNSAYSSNMDLLFNLVNDMPLLGVAYNLADDSNKTISKGVDGNGKSWIAIRYDAEAFKKIGLIVIDHQGFTLNENAIEFQIVDDTTDANDIVTAIGGYISEAIEAYGTIHKNSNLGQNPVGYRTIDGTSYSKLGETLNALNSKKLDISDACSDAFSATKLYQKGDYTIYNNDLYECITQHYGSWNASHFKKTTVATELQGRLKPFRTGTIYRIISQDNPSASSVGNGNFEINLQFTANLSASSWTNATVTMTNGVFNWFTPEMDEYLDITVGNISAFAGWDNKPILAHVKASMTQANKFNVAVKALDSADEGSNVTCFIHFTAYIYKTD